MVSVALASGGHLGRGPCPLGSRNATPVVGFGDCTHHARVVRPVLPRHPARSPPGSSRHAPPAAVCLVCQIPTHLLRCHRLGTYASLASEEFFYIPFRTPPDENPPSVVQRLDASSLL